MENKIFKINNNDSQETFSSKINHNFSEALKILNSNVEKIGEQGKEGKQGRRGEEGSKGSRGEMGSVWLIGPEPDIPLMRKDDYWIDSSRGNEIFKFNGKNLISEDFKLKRNFIFKKIINSNEEYNKNVIVQNNFIPYNNVLVLNSKIPNQIELNPSYSKLLIETIPNSNEDFIHLDQPLLEFFKSEENVNDNLNTSIFRWGKDILLNNNHDLVLDIRRGGMDIKSDKNIQLLANNKDINLETITGEININTGNLNVVFDKDLILKHDTGSSGYDVKDLNIVSNNIKIGYDSEPDESIFYSPLEINVKEDDYSFPAFEVENYIDFRGDGIKILLENPSYQKDVIVYKSSFEDEEFFSLLDTGHIRTNRIMENFLYSTYSGIEDNGQIYGGTIYNWQGIFPINYNGDSGNGKIEWEGQSMIILSNVINNRGIYFNVYQLINHLSTNERKSISLKIETRSMPFKIIGISSGNQNNNFYPKKSSEWKKFNINVYSLNITISIGIRYINTINELIEPKMEFFLFFEAFDGEGNSDNGSIYTMLPI